MSSHSPIRLLGTILTAALISACGDEGSSPIVPVEEPPISKDQFLSQDKVLSYFVAQSDAEKPDFAPAQMHREVIEEHESEGVKEVFWSLWHKANEKALGEIGFEGSERLIQLSLPQDEQMKVLCVPRAKKPATGYPLIIHLHGGGRYPNEPGPWTSTINEDEWRIHQAFCRTRYPEDPSYFVVPRMSDDRKGRWYFAPQVHIFKKVIKLGMLSGNIDPERIHVIGISEGGYGILRMGMFMPDYFSSIGVLAAAEELNGAEVNLRHLPFRMEVGENDFGYARNTYAYHWDDRMKELHAAYPNEYPHLVRIQKGRGHSINYFEGFPWMMEQRRKANPDRISYLYANIAPDYDDIHGRFSDGVYFIDFRGLKTSDRTDKMMFEVHKEGNTYDIKTQMLKGNISGKIALFIDRIERDKPVVVRLNGKTVHDRKVRATRGAIAESIALYGDPKRIYSSRVEIDL